MSKGQFRSLCVLALILGAPATWAALEITAGPTLTMDPYGVTPLSGLVEDLRLIKDRDELMTFFDFPAQHWQSIRTSNPIESAFATIRHRTKRTKGCLSRDGMLHMMFKLGQCAEKSWRKLRGFAHLADVIEGVGFYALHV